ncbi:hypothetical protein MN116_003378 [Schistosoma mekongi]|uniref:BHLH domain-containing protein n=1 Tax=Schistosoma mekongi TaxID=38744 RepID=A0AAE2D780_SCHME|nr:hypothetical protein MN116_003378 [Schistosoma mekongi]
MIPYTDICEGYARVPPVINTSSVHMPQHHSDGSNSTYPVPQNSSTPSRRGRRSNVPPEIREQTRRLKKQNMERRRRACISDKMNALHNLAMNLIGIDSCEYHKVEKADILNLCQSVFEGITNIAKDEPEFKSRLRKLCHNFSENSASASITSPSSSLVTSKNDHDSHAHEYKLSILSTIEKDNSLSTFTQHSHHHHTHSQHQNYPLSINNTPLNNKPQSIPFTLSKCDISPQMIDGDDKENRMPKLIFTNNSSTRNYATYNGTVNVSVNGNCSASLLSTVPISSSSSFSSSSVLSTPIGNLPSRTSRRMMQCQSTPLQYNDKYTSSLNDSDSGFFNSDHSLELMSNVKNVPTKSGVDVGRESDQCIGLCPVKSSSTSVSSCNVLMGCMSSLSSSSSSSSSQSQSLWGDRISAFSVPVKRSGIIGMMKSTGVFSGGNHYYGEDRSESLVVPMNSTSTSITSEIMKDSSPIMWRPYLD